MRRILKENEIYTVYSPEDYKLHMAKYTNGFFAFLDDKNNGIEFDTNIYRTNDIGSKDITWDEFTWLIINRVFTFDCFDNSNYGSNYVLIDYVFGGEVRIICLQRDGKVRFYDDDNHEIYDNLFDCFNAISSKYKGE